MKFIVFNGSPAGQNSNTHVISKAFLNGAEQAGAEVKNVFLAEKQFDFCRGCFTCWFQTPGKCVLSDDMTELLQEYNRADIVCFATPVYTWNMTAALKAFVDRLAPLKSPLIVQQTDNFDLADAKPKTQKFVVISNCGFPGNNNFETLKAVMSSCNPCLEIYRNCGKLLKSKEQAVRPVVEEYLKQVERAGFELQKYGEVTADTKNKLNMELMPIREYIKYLGM
ncbi:flavodoxin family protein [Aminipila butyrica]|uniref:Flavodoxin family protein n=1 Tax=Aminipila butyrica TaxID=433296 RepID=A0A858BUI0_9FIRM|nr:flavodoxin family protein [Aminipila butyrica]QIB69701.1 flavodoxin family protein [Aminipila butyrica]